MVKEQHQPSFSIPSLESKHSPPEVSAIYRRLHLPWLVWSLLLTLIKWQINRLLLPPPPSGEFPSSGFPLMELICIVIQKEISETCSNAGNNRCWGIILYPVMPYGMVCTCLAQRAYDRSLEEHRWRGRPQYFGNAITMRWSRRIAAAVVWMDLSLDCYRGLKWRRVARSLEEPWGSCVGWKQWNNNL